MLKSKSLIPHDRPVYREVIPQALSLTFKNPMLWILGAFAATLNTSGALDILTKFWSSVQTQSLGIYLGTTIAKIWQTSQHTSIHWLGLLQGLIYLLLFASILIALCVLSCVGQGALVFLIGTWKPGRKIAFRQSLAVGAQAILPIAVLNIITLAILWLARFGVSVSLAALLAHKSLFSIGLYVILFVIFFLFALFLAILQIYALNAMILQGSSLWHAFARSWEIIKTHWLVSLETAILQSIIVLGLSLGAAIIGAILSMPTIFLNLIAIFNQNLLLFRISMGVFVTILFIFLFVLLGLVVTFQYAIWTLMYRRFGEGGVVPKLHRLFRHLTNQTSVPQS